MKPHLSVILPSYNESKNISRGVLEEVYQFLKDYERSWELILSDDGSTDGTIEELKKFSKKDQRIKVILNQHKGKGPTVKSGMLQAEGSWRLFADFDQSTPLREVRKLLKHAGEYEVIFGSREAIGAKREKEPFYRHLMGRGFNFVVQILAVPGTQDSQCGFKLFSEKATQKLFNNLYIYSGENERQDAFTGAFDVELLYLARKYGFALKEVPILWKHFQTDRVSPVRDSFLMFADILRIKLADLTNKYPKE
jgi:glycosyltransferase involved in cell wall biosynthesis